MVSQVFTLKELAEVNIGPDEVGHGVYVQRRFAWYFARYEGRGIDKWRASDDLVAAPLMLRRTFAHSDPEIAVDDVLVSMDWGAPLPTNAIVLAVMANITEAFSDGEGGTFAVAVGISGGDPGLYAELDIDGPPLPQGLPAFLDASGAQLAVTFTGSAELSELISGAVTISVIYFVPRVAETLEDE